MMKAVPKTHPSGWLNNHNVSFPFDGIYIYLLGCVLRKVALVFYSHWKLSSRLIQSTCCALYHHQTGRQLEKKNQMTVIKSAAMRDKRSQHSITFFKNIWLLLLVSLRLLCRWFTIYFLCQIAAFYLVANSRSCHVTQHIAQSSGNLYTLCVTKCI